MLIEHRRSQSLVQEAEAKFRAAYYDDALDLLEGCEDWDAPVNEDAVLLKAEILVRRNPLASLQELTNSQDVFLTHSGTFDYLLALGRAYAASRNFHPAEAMYRKARKMLVGLEAEALPRVAVQEALLRWMKGDFDVESVEIIHAMQAETPRGKMSALDIRAWMNAGLERYGRQIADFSSALEIYSRNPEACDVYLVARIVHALLRVAMETGDEAGVRVAKSACEQIAWTPDIAVEQFQSIRVLGWHAFLSGEPMRAQRYLREALTIAPSAAWRVTAHLDRAHVAMINNNELWAVEETLEAERLAREVEWASTRGEERIGLATLGVLLAKVNMADAQRYVALYNQLGTSSVEPNLALTRDRRALAAERYASGKVQQTLGNHEAAICLLGEAYEIFARTRHSYRAALSAAALFEVTGEDDWQRRSQEHWSQYPRLCAGEHAPVQDAAPDDEIYGSLTPTQKQVLAAICEGLSASEMSVRFSRSVFTINKHIQAVYGAFEVHSRNELRAEARRRKLYGRSGFPGTDTFVKLVKS